jgi:hypothetical protein
VATLGVGDVSLASEAMDVDRPVGIPAEAEEIEMGMIRAPVLDIAIAMSWCTDIAAACDTWHRSVIGSMKGMLPRKWASLSMCQ